MTDCISRPGCLHQDPQQDAVEKGVLRDSHALVEASKQVLQKYLQKNHALELHTLEVTRFLPKPFSTTIFLRAVCSRTYRDFVVKQVLPSSQNDALIDAAGRALVEYDVLEMLYPRFVDITGCAVPKPIAPLPEHNALIMAYVPGTLLDSGLRALRHLSSRKNFTELCRNFILCGRWLRHFQDHHGITEGDSDMLRWLRAFADSRLQMIRQAGHPLFGKMFLDRAKALLDHEQSQLGKLPFPVSPCHGDFGPWNVLVNEDGITVVDFFGYQIAPLTVDIMRMLAFIDQLNIGPRHSRLRVRVLRDSFLDGFGQFPQVPRALTVFTELSQRIANLAGAVAWRPANLWQRYNKTQALRQAFLWFTRDDKRQFLWPV